MVAEAVQLSQGSLQDFVECRRRFELRYLRSAVARHSGNLSQAAAMLGIHRNTLRAKLQRNGSHPRRGQ
mgnify:CR=1 FL=1